MTAASQISKIVGDNGLRPAGKVSANPTAVGSYFIPIHMGETLKGRRNPSGKLLAELKRDLIKHGYNAEFLLMGETGQRMEEGLRHSLMSSYPNLVRNSFLSGNRDTPQVWLEAKRSLDAQEIKRLEVQVEEYARRMKLKAIRLNFMVDANTPTKTEVLSLIRKQAPVTLESLMIELVAQQFEIPSSNWLERSLVMLRRDGLLIQTGRGDYALSLDALRRLGTTKGRRSRDIDRLLALARRKD